MNKGKSICIQQIKGINMKKNKTPLNGIYMKESYIRHSNKPRISSTPNDPSSIYVCIRMTILVNTFTILRAPSISHITTIGIQQPEDIEELRYAFTQERHNP
jgi:hypothetical protein